MANVADRIRRVTPDLTLVQAHGKMSSVEIDDVMVRFGNGDGDVLLATNIIEAGLDVPRANTMIVIEGKDAISARTLKRLRTLATFDRLGAGFAISEHDLDMRGAGGILGEDQAGHMKMIGVDLYQHLLGAALRGEDVDRWNPELKLGMTGVLPQKLDPEADLRLSLYVRQSRTRDEAALDAFENELVDRFGPLPAETVRL